MRGRLGDIGSVFGGQLLAALGALAGVRLLTEFLVPAEFGLLTLLLGIVALLLSVLVNPLAQGILFVYSELSMAQRLPALRASLGAIAARGLRFALPVAALATLLVAATGLVPLSLLALLAALLLAEGARTICLSFLSASRAHARYAAWVAIDAWLRPLCAVAAIMFVGSTATVALTAQLFGAALMLAALGRGVLPTRAATQDSDCAALSARLIRYGLPLLPLGLLGWTSGLADRYLIGGLLSLADAGLYAAAYGLASRPLLMLSGAIELYMRPIYQNAVSAADAPRARQALRVWLVVMLGGGVALAALITLAAQPLTELLLGREYRETAASLMPWIALGYLFQGVGQLFERVCYASGDTRSVLKIQLATAAAAIVAMWIGIAAGGLLGGAIAVPVYLGVGALTAIVLARRTQAGVREPALTPTA